ncbi:MAG: hypothetical protein RL260_3815 [Pseudomonadota bacterium]|jgi:hypothetical protein
MSRQKFFDHYAASGDMRAAAAEAGISTLLGFKLLKMSGAMLVSDRLKFGSAGQKLGALAEVEFQRLVPNAKQMNTNERQHPGFDFLAGSNRVDVKASSIRKSGGWIFTLNAMPARGYGADYYVLIAALAGQTLSAGYDMYIIPAEMFSASPIGSVCIRQNKKVAHWACEFLCSPDDAAAFFADVQIACAA